MINALWLAFFEWCVLTSRIQTPYDQDIINSDLTKILIYIYISPYWVEFRAGCLDEPLLQSGYHTVKLSVWNLYIYTHLHLFTATIYRNSFSYIWNQLCFVLRSSIISIFIIHVLRYIPSYLIPWLSPVRNFFNRNACSKHIACVFWRNWWLMQ